MHWESCHLHSKHGADSGNKCTPYMRGISFIKILDVRLVQNFSTASVQNISLTTTTVLHSMFVCVCILTLFFGLCYIVLFRVLIAFWQESSFHSNYAQANRSMNNIRMAPIILLCNTLSPNVELKHCCASIGLPLGIQYS